MYWMEWRRQLRPRSGWDMKQAVVSGPFQLGSHVLNGMTAPTSSSFWLGYETGVIIRSVSARLSYWMEWRRQLRPRSDWDMKQAVVSGPFQLGSHVLNGMTAPPKVHTNSTGWCHIYAKWLFLRPGPSPWMRKAPEHLSIFLSFLIISVIHMKYLRDETDRICVGSPKFEREKDAKL